ncbi:potassium channel family protein [Sulfuricaulis sp.]|jgi:hypothetical protein|uniref:potassium channel family protein n=1 Tax=Sulfuricaulis sp. TaxID=2003553 RepID=UPI0035595F06
MVARGKAEVPAVAPASAGQAVSTKSMSERYAELRSRRVSMIDLLVTLVLLMVAAPFVHQVQYGQLIEAVLLTLVLLSAVAVVGASRRMLLLATVLAAPAVVGSWINHVRPDWLPPEIYLTSSLLFVAFVVVNLLRFTLRAPRVNVEVLCAAISNYLMIGLLWMFAYLLAARLVPDAFSFTVGPASDRLLDGFNALYFSFVTLSTVGYGDIVPLSRVVRMLSILEATTGMFYVTVLVARLVALYSTEGSQQGASDTKKR